MAAERYGARYATLDTTSWEVVRSEDGKGFYENVGTDSRNVRWYRRRGYEVYKVSLRRVRTPSAVGPGPDLLGISSSNQPPKPKYPEPTPDDPDYRLSASFFKKALSA